MMCIRLAATASLMIFSALSAFAAEDAWDIGRLNRFDRTGKAYAIEKKSVKVDLVNSQSLCPTGLGNIAEGREDVQKITIRYRVSSPSACWLHVQWDPGGSGIEQFNVACNGENCGNTEAVNAAAAPEKVIVSSFQIAQKAGISEVTLTHLSGDGLHFHSLALTADSLPPRPLPPSLKFPTIEAFSKAIGEPAVLVDSRNICMFVPRRREAQAKIVLPYLIRAYDELQKLTGVDTKYKIVVEAFPVGNRNAGGGTAGCVIHYSDENLQLDKHEEWRKYRVPHVSGYIEEMAHNFVHATGAEFGWEMIGWTIGAKVSEIVAPNPIHRRALNATRRGQDQTYARYVALGHTFPPGIAANQADRIHSYLLRKCEEKYGPNFWQDFFAEVAKERAAFTGPGTDGDGTESINLRYRITVNCFDRLPGLNFKRMLEDNGISTTVAIQSLKPTKAGWNRTLH